MTRGRGGQQDVKPGFCQGHSAGLRRRQSLGGRPSFAYANFKLFLISNRPVFLGFQKKKKILCVPTFHPHCLCTVLTFSFGQNLLPGLSASRLFLSSPHFLNYIPDVPPCLKASGDTPSTTENCLSQSPSCILSLSPSTLCQL